MFIGKYELDGKIHNNIYYGNINKHELWKNDILYACNIETLDFKIGGKTYRERKYNLEELAKDFQLYFGYLSWSYGELAEIENYFYENGKRYGLLKEFKENCIC